MQIDLKRVSREGTPLIDGEAVTFVWRGDPPPMLIGDLTHWEYEPRIRLEPAGPGLWAYSTTFAPDAYIEYAFVEGSEFFPDPLNRRRVSNGLGGVNSFFYMPQGGPTRYVRRRRYTTRGRVFRHRMFGDIMVPGGERAVHFYEPPVDDPVPLLVVFDGGDYLRRANLIEMVDDLIAEGRIRPLALALVENARQARFIEYACSDSVPLFLKEFLVPYARYNLNLIDVDKEPGAYGVMGASMGGLMSLYTAWRLPHVFARVLSQSGAFTMYETDQVLYDLVRHAPPRPLTIWMDVGRYERLRDTNRRMYSLLQERGYDVTLREYSGGHNYSAWQNDVHRGLEHLFGRAGE